MRNFPLPILLLMVLSLMGCSAKHPSDQVLLTDFENHKAEFNQLLEMFLADKKMSRVSYHFTRPENPSEVGVSEQRLQEYRDLFAKLDLSDGMEGNKDKDMVWFYASLSGVTVATSSKGFAYSSKPPQYLANSLDGYRSPDGKAYTVFRHIEGNWYLYLDVED
jgi:hypothetical protein